MSALARSSAVDAAAFVGSLLQREGALAELSHDGALECVLPSELCSATGLAEAARLRLLGSAGAGETSLALESAAVRWCVERALSRGRHAAVELVAPQSGKSAALAETVAARFDPLNGTLRPRGNRPARLSMLMLELRYEAVGEERVDGSLFVAHEPALGLVSVPLAGELLRRLTLAAPARAELDEAALSRSAAAVERHVLGLLRAALAPLQERLGVRMARDAERLRDYYRTLLREANRRRRAAKGLAASAEKATAIERARDEKLRELAFRYGVEVRLELASALEVGYSAPACDVVLLRRKREIPLTLVWDPFLRDLLPLLCRACGEPSLAFHACDEAGHLTCARCASPCARCARVTCRLCVPAGCKVCGAG